MSIITTTPLRQGPVDAHALGLVLGACFGAWLAVWSLLVMTGWAQAVIDVVFWLHFIAPPYRVGPFDAWRALGLIGVTSGLGYAFGRLAAVVWNGLTRPASTGHGR